MVLVFSNSNELVRVKPERIVYIKSDGNYSSMVLHDKSKHVFSMNLGHWQQLMEEQLGSEASRFIRIGKQLIINYDYVFRVNISTKTLVLSDRIISETFILSASKEALKQLMNYIETKI